MFVSFYFSLIATWNKNGRKINCRYVQLQRVYPATRTDMLDILCTRRYLNKRGMRNAYVKNTNTNLRRSPDMSVWWSLAAEVVVSGGGGERCWAAASGSERPSTATERNNEVRLNTTICVENNQCIKRNIKIPTSCCPSNVRKRTAGIQVCGKLEPCDELLQIRPGPFGV